MMIDTSLDKFEQKFSVSRAPVGAAKINWVYWKEKEDYGLGEYVTIHITPEPQFSYVSFESNIPAASYLSIVTNILNTFNPGKFILTIFATKV